MTSYTVHLPVEGDRDNQFWTFLHGAARAVLDTAYVDVDGETVDCRAEQWHSPEPGWETSAIDPLHEGRVAFTDRVEKFFNAHYDDLVRCVGYLRAGDDKWSRTLGMSWYRAGMLYVLTCRGEGVGFWEHHHPSAQRLSKACEGEGGIQAEAQPAGHPLEHVVSMVEV